MRLIIIIDFGACGLVRVCSRCTHMLGRPPDGKVRGHRRGQRRRQNEADRSDERGHHLRAKGLPHAACGLDTRATVARRFEYAMVVIASPARGGRACLARERG